MPNETLIAEIENVLSEIIRLGGENERTQIVPNLTVQDANPSGLDGFVIVSDDRDGDNILAKKVGSVVYSNNDLVNVLFPLGGEAIAFQQGSQSPNSGIWEIISGTNTDIYYDKGDVGIGKAVAPDAALEILDTSQAQLRLTHTEDTKFADFTLDTNHDLTIDPSSTGQIILATDDVVIQEDLIHSGDTDTKMIFTVDDIEFQAGGLSMLKLTEAAQDLITLGPGSGDVDIDFNGDMFLQGSDGNLGIGKVGPTRAVDIYRASGNTAFFLEVGDGSDASFQLKNTSAQWNTRNSGGDYQIREVTPATATWLTVQSTTGYFGFNRTSPEGQLHGYDAISGIIKWEYDGLDGTSRTIISNGAGDVVYRLTGMYVLRASGGARASGTLDVNNSASQGLAVGGNTVTVAVAASGATTVSRTAGTDTIRVTFLLLWL